MAEGLKEAGTIQVQAERYEGYTVLGQRADRKRRHRDPLRPGNGRPRTEADRRSAGTCSASSPTPPPPRRTSPTSNEDTARLAFEAGESAFMLNYTFAFASAKEERSRNHQGDGRRTVPAGQRQPGETAARRLQPRASAPTRATGAGLRSGRLPLRREEQLTAAELDGLPPSARKPLHGQGRHRRPIRASPGWSRKSIEAAGPRPAPPAYQDVTSAIQRTLHPPDKIDPRRHRKRLRRTEVEPRSGRQAGRAALMEASAQKAPAATPAKVSSRTRSERKLGLDALRAGGDRDAGGHRLPDRLRGRPLAAEARPALPRTDRIRRPRTTTARC